jgi:hypothetical protein
MCRAGFVVLAGVSKKTLSSPTAVMASPATGRGRCETLLAITGHCSGGAMLKVLHSISVLLLWCGCLLGGDDPAALHSDAEAAREDSSAVRSPAQPDGDEPEEPDFAFIAGGPYTQKKNSIQFILPAEWGRRTSILGGSILQHAEFGTLLRTEWGLTDRWELDVIMSAEGERDRLRGRTLTSDFSLTDSVIGVRYRLLQESSAPFSLAMGPQFIVPSGSLLRGTGFDTTGFAWDVAAAKDWGGPAFLYTSVNFALFPSVRDPTIGSSRDFNLHNLFWAAALGLRPLEKPHGTSHHDIHLFLEYGLGHEDRLETGAAGTTRVSELVTVLAPGIRYGFLTRTKKLLEVGVSFPIGLNHNTPRGSVVLQLQFENVFGYRGK